MSRAHSHFGIYFIIILSMLGSLALSACGPLIPRAQAEQEAAEAMLDYLIARQGGASTSYRRMPPQPWNKAPYEAGIIVWAPPNPGWDQQGTNYLDTDRPVKVWWLSGAELTEVASDKAAAVQDYRATHMTQRPAGAKWGWNYTEFGILSMSGGNQQARVYVGESCGPLCGMGTIYSLERDASGAWTIRASEMRWIS